MIQSSRRPRLAAAALAVSALLVAISYPTGSAAAAEDPVAGPLLSYVVNSKSNSSDTRAAAEAVVAHGGTVIATYRKIGVVVARSTDPAFAPKLRSLGRKSPVLSVGQTRHAAIAAADGGLEVAAEPAGAATTELEPREPM